MTFNYRPIFWRYWLYWLNTKNFQLFKEELSSNSRGSLALFPFEIRKVDIFGQWSNYHEFREFENCLLFYWKSARTVSHWLKKNFGHNYTTAEKDFITLKMIEIRFEPGDKKKILKNHLNEFLDDFFHDKRRTQYRYRFIKSLIFAVT